MNQHSEQPQADAGAPRREAIRKLHASLVWNWHEEPGSCSCQHCVGGRERIRAFLEAALDQRTRERGTASDTSSIAKALAEAITVLDEPFHREAVARVMAEAVAEIERHQLELQEVRGTVAAWKQEYAQLVRKNEIAGHAADAERARITRERELYENAQCIRCAKHLDADEKDQGSLVSHSVSSTNEPPERERTAMNEAPATNNRIAAYGRQLVAHIQECERILDDVPLETRVFMRANFRLDLYPAEWVREMAAKLEAFRSGSGI